MNHDKWIVLELEYEDLNKRSILDMNDGPPKVEGYIAHGPFSDQEMAATLAFQLGNSCFVLPLNLPQFYNIP